MFQMRVSPSTALAITLLSLAVCVSGRGCDSYVGELRSQVRTDSQRYMSAPNAPMQDGFFMFNHRRTDEFLQVQQLLGNHMAVLCTEDGIPDDDWMQLNNQDPHVRAFLNLRSLQQRNVRKLWAKHLTLRKAVAAYPPGNDQIQHTFDRRTFHACEAMTSLPRFGQNFGKCVGFDDYASARQHDASKILYMFYLDDGGMNPGKYYLGVSKNTLAERYRSSADMSSGLQMLIGDDFSNQDIRVVICSADDSIFPLDEMIVLSLDTRYQSMFTNKRNAGMNDE